MKLNRVDKHKKIIQHSIAARTALISIISVLMTCGSSLYLPFASEKECLMLKCRKRFGTPWLLVLHLLECDDTCKGQWKCLDPNCNKKHVLQRWPDTSRALRSPVELLRRLSGGRKRGRHPSPDSAPSGKKGRVEDEVAELPTCADIPLELSGISMTHELADTWVICSDDTIPDSSFDDETTAQDSSAWEDESQVPTVWSDSLVENAERGSLTTHKSMPDAAAGAGSLVPSFVSGLGHASHFSSAPSSAMVSCHSLTVSPRAMEPVHDLNQLTWFDANEPAQYSTPTIANHHHLEACQPSLSDATMSPQVAYDASHVGFRPAPFGQSNSATPFGTQGMFPPEYVPNIPRRQSAPQGPFHPRDTSFQGAGFFNSPPSSAVTTGSIPFGAPELPAAYTQWTPRTTNGIVGGPPTPSSSQPSRRGSGRGEGDARAARAPTRTRSGPGPSPTPTELEAAGWTIETMLWEAEASGFQMCPCCGYRPTGQGKNLRSHLKRHLQIHLPNNRVQCPLPGCPQTLAAGRHDNVQAHLRNVHRLDAAAIQQCGTTVVETASASAREAGGADPDEWSSFGDEDSRELHASAWGQDGESNGLGPGGHFIPPESDVLNGIASEVDFDFILEEDSLLADCEDERPSLSNLGVTAWRS